MLDNFKTSFYQNFIQGDRWKYIVDGLGNTLRITFFAVLIGVVLGFLIAVIYSTCDKTHRLGFLNALCKIYLAVIRGTPVLTQLLTIYFVVFGSVKIDRILVAAMAFGINSGIYVAETFRSGIMSIDNGQFGAGRSPGSNYTRTVIYITVLQAFKNVLSTLCNEFIVPLKETSVAGYTAIRDLTKGTDITRSRTYSAFMSLIAAVAIYSVMVMILTYFVQKLERRLRSSDH